MAELPKRKHPRLKEFDYCMNGYYHVTICTQDNLPILSAVKVGRKIWQTSFYDEISRNEQAYKEIWRYINENPIKGTAPHSLDILNAPHRINYQYCVNNHNTTKQGNGGDRPDACRSFIR